MRLIVGYVAIGILMSLSSGNTTVCGFIFR